ncbi:hypothetical protein N8I71_13330 [Roseibacterium sp. SDUM158016]|jgi:hypothetical protein|uniref:hypothetical protein n=1 Tax=Roseicyclus sediminis TaxID=2980997 RepID=UPI0021CF3A34|nr:hypothetical protein [Roseibacterium sp. SDUM158016]MCU4653821.1 hypothetical protein [Roseibacterium sp. SDUM158016]
MARITASPSAGRRRIARKGRGVAAALAFPALLAGCWGERADFMAACQEDGTSRAYCACQYGVARDVLSDAEFTELVALLTLPEDQAQRRLLEGGLLGGVSLGLALAQLEQETRRQCRGA